MTPEFEPKLSLTQRQKDIIAAAEQNLTEGLIAHEKLREFWEPDEWIGRPSSFDQFTEVRKLARDIQTYMRAVLNELAEVSLSAGTTNEVREYIQNGAAAYLSDAYARVNYKDAPLLDRSSIDRLVNNACAFLTERATAKHESMRRPKPRFGAVVESNFRYEEFPKVKYHWTKKEVTVKSAAEELALRGWGDSPNDFAPYRGPRVAPVDQRQLTQWVDNWQVTGLDEEHRRRIKAQLLRADSAFWSAPEAESADLSAMKVAFGGVAKVLFNDDILSEKHLEEEIPSLVWDSAIAGGWYRFASEAPARIFPEQLGHYFVWRDETKDWKGLFRAETAKWLAELLDKSSSDHSGDRAPSKIASPPIEGADPIRSADIALTVVTPPQAGPARERFDLDPLDDPGRRPLLWSRFSLERTSKDSKFLLLVPDTHVSFSIPAPHTNRDIVARIAKESHIPIESLSDDLDQPVFTRGQPIFGYVGDQLDEIARNYSHMRWWVSDNGLNMAIVSASASIPRVASDSARSQISSLLENFPELRRAADASNLSDEIAQRIIARLAPTLSHSASGKNHEVRSGPPSGKKKLVNDPILKVKHTIRQLKAAGHGQHEICQRLADAPRPKNAAWKALTWPAAFKDKAYRRAVKSWISRVK